MGAPAAAQQWETVVLRNLADCLLDAYDLISRSAYQRYVRRGRRPGGELSDWLSAECEIIRRIPVDLEDAPAYVSALACVPAQCAADVEVGIEARWLAILARRGATEDARVDFPPDSSQAWLPENCAAVEGAAPDGSPFQIFCVVELPAEVDPASSIAVLSNGLLGIRMIKRHPAHR